MYLSGNTVETGSNWISGITTDPNYFAPVEPTTEESFFTKYLYWILGGGLLTIVLLKKKGIL
jgi:hypothetical protein